jgi:hypothetical protein
MFKRSKKRRRKDTHKYNMEHEDIGSEQREVHPT